MEKAVPLYQLLKKGVPWTWKAEYYEVISKLKALLMAASALPHKLVSLSF